MYITISQNSTISTLFLIVKLYYSELCKFPNMCSTILHVKSHENLTQSHYSYINVYDPLLNGINALHRAFQPWYSLNVNEEWHALTLKHSEHESSKWTEPLRFDNKLPCNQSWT